MLKERKNKQKEAGIGPFFLKKNQIYLFHTIITRRRNFATI